MINIHTTTSNNILSSLTLPKFKLKPGNRDMYTRDANVTFTVNTILFVQYHPPAAHHSSALPQLAVANVKTSDEVEYWHGNDDYTGEG